MNQGIAPLADNASGSTGHRGMYSIGAEARAVVGIGGFGSGLARII